MSAEVSRLEFRLHEMKDSSGQSIVLQVSRLEFPLMEQKIFSSVPVQACLIESGLGARFGIYLRKRIGSFSPTSPTLWRAMVLIRVVAEHAGSAGSSAVIFLSRMVWLSELAVYSAEHGVELEAVKNRPREWAVRFTLLMKGIRGAAVRFYHGVIPGPVSVPPSPSTSMARLGVDYHGNLNLTRAEHHSDLFFLRSASIPGSDLVVLFSHSHDPLDAAKREDLRQSGIEAIALDRCATQVKDITILSGRGYEPDFRWIRKSGLCRSAEWNWLIRQEAYYDMERRWWSSVFGRSGIKIFLTWFKYAATHCVLSAALEESDGVLAIYQRSHEEVSSPFTAVSSDILFAFSPANAEKERRSGSRIRYHIATGYYGDHRFPLLRSAALEISRKIRRAGAARILAYFDENTLEDDRWYPGHDSARVHYAFLLEQVLSNSWLGLVLKPKIPKSLRRRLGPVAELLRRAEETGRCMVIGEGSHHSLTPPALAALAADVAIHGHLYAATAGVESALAGVPTVLLDGEGCRDSDLYRLGPGRVVFQSWEDLWRICQEHFQKGPVAGFGDWSLLLPDLDPFRDGRAAERIGIYVKWLLDGYRSGRRRDEVLADAAMRYGKKWGYDKISEVGWPTGGRTEVA